MAWTEMEKTTRSIQKQLKLISAPPWLIIVLAIFIGFFFIALKANIPLNYQEVRESYTAYSMGIIGKDTNGISWPVFFRADNNYLSTLGVYLRIPSIHLFGLNNIGTRLPGVVVGLAAIWIFYLVVSRLLKNDAERIVAVIFFSLSPLLLQTSLLNLGTESSLVVFLTTIYFIMTTKTRNIKIGLGIGVFALISFLYVSKFQPQFAGFIKRESVIQEILPASYSFQYAKRLSFDQLYGSPLIKGSTNYNRIVFNKYFYGVNAIFQSFVTSFNLEKSISPFQSQTILSKENFYSRYIPAFYFWEIPIAIIGLIIYLKRKDKNLLIFWSGLLIACFFKNSLIFLVPAITVCESVCIYFLLSKVKGKVKLLAIIAASALYLLSIFVLNISILGNYRLWFDENSLRQYQIWSKVSDQDIKNDKIFVTDRLGEPLFYLLFYKKIDPGYYLSNKVDGPLLNGEIQRVSSVGNVIFGSFNYSNEKRVPHEIWVGLSGEFDSGYIKTGSQNIPDGVIMDKIKEVSVIDGKTIGDELWFVRTNQK